MVALHYLKYTHDLSNGAVLRGRVENPCWQYLSGMKYFSHEMPVDASSMSRWRRLIGEAGAEELLKETIRAGLRLRIIKPSQLKRVNVDTTVQEKYIRFPTDARLYDRMRQRLVAAARREGESEGRNDCGHVQYVRFVRRSRIFHFCARGCTLPHGSAHRCTKPA